MFCPQCKDEFRAGFTRCGRCNVDLVDRLTEASPGVRQATIPTLVRMGEYCGFVSLDEARQARDQLREKTIASEIVIREPPGGPTDRTIQEEYWLRVDVSRMREVVALLGGVPEVETEPAENEADFACGGCGANVAAAESFCPKCGARFDD